MDRVENIKLLDKWKRYTLQEMLDADIILSHLDGNHGELYPNKDEFIESGVPYLSANCIVADEVDFTKTKFLTHFRANTFKKGVAINGDVLFAHNATVGPVAILKTDLDFVILSTTLTYYRCNIKYLLPNYLRLYMISDYFINQYTEVMRQATRNQVPITKQRTFFHLVPPIPEQQYIVSIVDEAFAAIGKAKENAEQNLKNAKELFESYLQGVFEKKGEGWTEKMIGEVLQKTETVDPTKKPDEEFIYLDVSSVNKETKKIESPTILIGKDAPSRARKLVKTNDVIFATVRPTHSRVALISEEYNDQVCSTGYFVLRTKEFLCNNLVFYFLLTFGFNKQMEKLQKGASYPAVTDSEVKSIIIPYPKSLSEQQTIVSRLDALSLETQRLEGIYRQKIADLEELKKSVLQKAFRGELKMN